MTRSADDNIIVGLDIGTATISLVVAELLPDNQINIIGAAESEARGMDKGGVNDFESVVKSIQRVLNKVELMTEHRIEKVYLSISGEHIGSRIEKGMGTISDDEVSQEDVDQVIHTAKSVKIGDEQRILHVIPQEFTIDSQKEITNPVGLSGMRMEANVHLITCHSDMAKNISKAVERCNLKVEQFVYSGLAASYAVLSEDERELGVCVIDIGAGTMDVAIWTGGVLRYSEVFPYAGKLVTSDLAFAFGTPPSEAEQIKVKYGCAALAELDNKDEMLSVPTVGGRPARVVMRSTLTEVIEPRYAELMGFVNQSIMKVQEDLQAAEIKHQLAAGIVLTGGGAQIEGIVHCAERVFRNDVRVGKPLNIGGLTDYVNQPSHATVVGLLHYAKESQTPDEPIYHEPKSWRLTDLMTRLRNWIQREF